MYLKRKLITRSVGPVIQPMYAYMSLITVMLRSRSSKPQPFVLKVLLSTAATLTPVKLAPSMHGTLPPLKRNHEAHEFNNHIAHTASTYAAIYNSSVTDICAMHAYCKIGRCMDCVSNPIMQIAAVCCGSGHLSPC